MATMERPLDKATGMRVAACANRIALWLGMRDIAILDQQSLQQETGLKDGVADLLVLFGGGILGSVDFLACAMRRGVARRYAVVGGRGHATYGLARSVQKLLLQASALGNVVPVDMPDPQTASEAHMIRAVLRMRYGLAPDLLETQSTNCGNNIEYLLDLLDKEPVVPKSVVLCQDAAMQRRMDATWRKQVADRPRYAAVRVINWAFYQTEVVWTEGKLAYVDAPDGMWDIDRYLSLLIGDVARLVDDEHGYGPRGAGYIVHVDVPADVLDAWHELRALRPHDARLL